MKSMVAVVLTLLTAGLLFAARPGTAVADGMSKDRVVAMYFHRTQRCPTCRKMGGYSEEAVRRGFAKQIQEGKVAFYHVDFENPRNARLAEGYGVTGPTLIVAKIHDGKVAKAVKLTDIWNKVADKQAFVQYVQTNVAALVR